MALRPDWLPALAAFEAAARHQNFTHAAEELHLTSSAVSHHVRRLESRLGVHLFQRHARGVSLTVEGRELADASSSAFADLEVVLQGMRGPRQQRDRVGVTTLHSLAFSWLIPRLPRFFALHPDIHVRIDTEASLTRFDDGGPDLGIRHGPGQWPGIAAQHLMPDWLFPVTSPALRDRLQIREVADMQRMPLIADLSRQGWRDWFQAAGLPYRQFDERISFSDTTDAFAAATEGLGAALAREVVVRPWIEDGRLVALPGPRMPARWAYYAVHPSHRRLRPAAQRFLDWVVAEAREDLAQRGKA